MLYEGFSLVIAVGWQRRLMNHTSGATDVMACAPEVEVSYELSADFLCGGAVLFCDAHTTTAQHLSRPSQDLRSLFEVRELHQDWPRFTTVLLVS